MDLVVLKKKISTFKSEKGLLRRVSDDLLYEILNAWEAWTGPMLGFYSAIGVDRRKMASLIGKAKKLKREGHFPAEDFKEVRVEGSSDAASFSVPCSGMEITWGEGKVIRFSQVDQLVDFLKKAA